MKHCPVNKPWSVVEAVEEFVVGWGLELWEESRLIDCVLGSDDTNLRREDCDDDDDDDVDVERGGEDAGDETDENDEGKCDVEGKDESGDFEGSWLGTAGEESCLNRTDGWVGVAFDIVER